MENKDVLNMLNERTKQIIDDMFSFVDSYFLDSKGMLTDGIIAYAFILSSFKNDKIVQKFFESKGIDYNLLLDNFEIEETPLSKLCIPFKSADKTNGIKQVNLESTFNKMLTKVKYTSFLENQELSVDMLEPYQIFDYLVDKYVKQLQELLNVYMDFNQETIDELSNYFNKYYKEFALSFNIDMSQKENDEKEGITRYSYFDCDIFKKDDIYYITFKETTDFNKIVKHSESESSDDMDYLMNLKLPTTFQILTIDRKHVYDKLMLRLPEMNSEKSYDFKLMNIEDKTVLTLTLDKFKTFLNAENAKNFMFHSDFLDDLARIKQNDSNTVKLYTPTLNRYGRNMVERRYLKNPCVGRDTEIEDLELILSYPERDVSIIITGEAGCGKTSLVEGLAYKIQKGEVPDHLKGLNIIKINVSAMTLGTKYVGTLEEKMDEIIKEARLSKNILLFIDEIHQSLGAGTSEKSNISVAEILKPALGDGEIRIISATTTDEYFKYMCDDEAFKTRFKRVKLSEPDEGTIYQIIDNLIESYNKLHEKVDYLCPRLELEDSERDQVIKWLINVTSHSHRRYDDQCNNPRLVLDIIKYAYANATMRRSETVSLEDIAAALNKEERLNADYKRRAIPELLAIKPQEEENNIIEFKLIKK